MLLGFIPNGIIILGLLLLVFYPINSEVHRKLLDKLGRKADDSAE